MSSINTNSLVVNIGGKSPLEYRDQLHEAITQVGMLLFERRELSLHETQSFALYTLTDFLQRLHSIE